MLRSEIMLGLWLGGVLICFVLIPFTTMDYKDLQAELSELNVKGARKH